MFDKPGYHGRSVKPRGQLVKADFVDLVSMPASFKPAATRRRGRTVTAYRMHEAWASATIHGIPGYHRRLHLELKPLTPEHPDTADGYT